MTAGGMQARLFPLLVAAAMAALGSFLLFSNIERVLTVIPDDAAYYFETAENVASGKGLTFDGIDRTNGFQPLWLYLLVPAYAIYHGTPESMYRFSLLLQILLLGGAALCLTAVQTRLFHPKAALMSLLLFLFFVFVPAANGMESAVLVLCLVLLLFFGWRGNVFGRYDPPRQFAFGIMLGLAVLARLDMIFLAFAVGAWWLLRLVRDPAKRRETCIALCAVSGGALLVVAPYLVYNYLSFGSIFPISVALKSSFPAVTTPGYALAKLGKRGWLGILLALGYLGWFGARSKALTRNADGGTYYETAMAVMAGALLLHFAHTVLFLKWAVFSWHFIPYTLFGAAALCAPVDRYLAVTGRVREVLYWSVVAAVILLGGATVVRNFSQPLDRNWRPVAYEAALWARQATSSDAVFAMKDAGNFGFFSERSVVNLDGVMNNLEYQAALRDERLAAYLESRGVRFIVQHAFWGRPEMISGEYDSYAMAYPSHLYDSAGDTLVLLKADEVYRSKPYFDGPYRTVLIIWRWRNG